MKEFEEEEIIKIFKNEYGKLNAMIASEENGFDYINSSIIKNSDMDEDLIDTLIEYFNEKELKVGFISSFFVEEEYRGYGAGSKLMNTFKKEIMSQTDVDILLARTENKQKKGFELENFYKKNGFETVFLDCGDLLMVSKGYELILDDVLDLKRIRKQQLDYFSKQTNISLRNKVNFDFVKRKELRINEILKNQKNENVDNDLKKPKSTIKRKPNKF